MSFVRAVLKMNRFVESTFLYIELKGNDFLYSMVYKNILFSEVLNLKGEKFLNFDTDTFVTLLLSFRGQMSQDSEKATRLIYKEKREGHSSGLL